MNLLAIDSASSILSVAVCREEEIFCEDIKTEMKQSEFVMDIIDNLMKKAALKPDDLDGIIYMGGPGSFTGLRIGCSIAKGLALSLSRPIIAVPTLECISFNNEEFINTEYKNNSLKLSIIQARKNSWFYAFFRNEVRLTNDEEGDFLQLSDEISKYNEKILLSGYGAVNLFELLPEILKEKIILIEKTGGYAKELISIAKKRNLIDNDNTAFLFSGPEYIRKTDAELRNPV